MVKQSSRCPQKLTGKAIETLLAIVEKFFGAILSFLYKTGRFVAEHARNEKQS